MKRSRLTYDEWKCILSKYTYQCLEMLLTP